MMLIKLFNIETIFYVGALRANILLRAKWL